MQASIGSHQSGANNNGGGAAKNLTGVQYGNQALAQGEKPRITINLMDVSFLEQNLQQILEVSRVLSI